jgi:hypothetical protein
LLVYILAYIQRAIVRQAVSVSHFAYQMQLKHLACKLHYLQRLLPFATYTSVHCLASAQGFITSLIANPFDPALNKVFLVVFNALGIMPAIYSQLLLPGSVNQKPLPAAPFVFGSIAGGFFLLGPYLAFRQYRPRVDESALGLVGRFSNSRINGLLTVVLTLGLGAFAVSSNALSDWSEYVQLFSTQTLVHVSSVDAVILQAALWEPLREDMQRRGWYTDGSGSENAKLAAICAVPLLGPALYLAARPALLPFDSSEQ